MTLSEITYNILNTLRGGRSFNNEHYSEEQIKFNIEYYRALLIRRDVDRNTRTVQLEQDLGFLDMEVVDPSEETANTISEQIIGSVFDIPIPIRLRDDTFGIKVSLTNRHIAIPLIEYHEANWQQYNRFTSAKMRAYYLNDKVFVVGNKLLGYINSVIAGTLDAGDIPASAYLEALGQVNVRGIFEKPRKAYEFATGEDFDDDSDDYPLPYDYVQRITQSMLSTEFKVMSSAPLDTKPNQIPDEKAV